MRLPGARQYGLGVTLTDKPFERPEEKKELITPEGERIPLPINDNGDEIPWLPIIAIGGAALATLLLLKG